MMRVSPATLAVCGFLCHAPVFSRQSPAYDPPLELKRSAIHQGVSFAADRSPNGLSLDVSLNPFEKRIELLWEEHATGRAHGQRIPVPYTPTALAAGASHGEVYVGGTDELGFTRIVRYLLRAPGLGENGVLEDAPLAEAKEVFRADERSATRDVYQMLPNRAAPGRQFVQFWHTKDVVDLNVATGEATRVVSATAPAPGSIVVTELANPHGFTYSRDHKDNGFVYFFCSVDPEEGGSQTVVLRDLDRDGALDDGRVVTLAQYQSMGFADPARYND